jgi:hypothetical protein
MTCSNATPKPMIGEHRYGQGILFGKGQAHAMPLESQTYGPVQFQRWYTPVLSPISVTPTLIDPPILVVAIVALFIVHWCPISM